MNCAFTEKDGIYICLREGCGTILRVGVSGLDIKNTCSSSTGRLTDTPTNWDKVKNFSLAFFKHAVHGFQQCALEDIEQRKNICSLCEFNKNWVCQRKSCGCSILEKIEWKSEDCPEKKWPKPE